MDELLEFGCNLFNDEAMHLYLSTDVYDEFNDLVHKGSPITLELAEKIAEGMKGWAMDRGVIRFTHWFQPMTGITAEKHDSFLNLKKGKPIYDFSAKELIQGEPDASSFPSGGLRATFEARGYTAWDPTSPAFIKDGTLCLPSAFCSFEGLALDKKTPLLRSICALRKAALRILKLFGKKNVKNVDITVGAEQEYFLIDKELFDKRKDLIMTGRTLFGTLSPMGKDIHYYGAISNRVQAFMKELDSELVKLGIIAKTEHKEVAPSQYELAPLFNKANLSADGNQLTMELMKKIALKHNLVCLLHEKPFYGVNGSGKHTNWSMITDRGDNLLAYGDTPEDNMQFLLFLTAIIAAVDDFQDLLQISVSDAGNDLRLGGNEAPPSVISVYLGKELTEILSALEKDITYQGKKKEKLKIGVDVFPVLPKGHTDRNRTSPFAFTGDRFEFRSPGASSSISCPIMIINTIVADSLARYANELERAEDFDLSLRGLLKREIELHKRIIFNGNGYDDSWKEESVKRGLLAFSSVPETIIHYSDRKNVDLFSRQEVLTETELSARREILIANYRKDKLTEAYTMLYIIRRNILPAMSKYSLSLLKCLAEKEKHSFCLEYEKETLSSLSVLSEGIYNNIHTLECNLKKVDEIKGSFEKAYFISTSIVNRMSTLKGLVDKVEQLLAEEYLPYPLYDKLLFSID